MTFRKQGDIVRGILNLAKRDMLDISKNVSGRACSSIITAVANPGSPLNLKEKMLMWGVIFTYVSFAFILIIYGVHV